MGIQSPEGQGSQVSELLETLSTANRGDRENLLIELTEAVGAERIRGLSFPGLQFGSIPAFVLAHWCAGTMFQSAQDTATILQTLKSLGQ